jgi:hypothetical protein
MNQPAKELTPPPGPEQLTPHMEPDSLALFKELVQGVHCYLEYGSGGSTVHAAKIAQANNIISVESDRAWIEKVRGSIGKASSNLYLEHCDIGETTGWGNPKDRQKVNDFWKYAAIPWQIARRMHLVPNLILIDGRFRVASFLTSLLSARAGTPILFDDYFDRPRYFVAESFCPVESRRGRMAVFNAARNFSSAEICERISEYSVLSDT